MQVSVVRPRVRSARACASWAATDRCLCITHLPQIASLGDRHFSVVKDTAAAPTRATVVELTEGDVVAELVRMLGADAADSAARAHARDLRKAA